MARDLSSFVDGRLAGKTPLLKDPFAIFSLQWFAQALNCRLVVTIRHPAAFASGLKRLNWTFAFENLLEQPLLMSDHLEQYRGMLTGARAGDVIGQAAVLWTVIYATLQNLRSSVPGLHVVRHEDLASEPVEGFRDLYRGLGLRYSAHIEKAILRSSSPDNPVELSRRRVHSVKMDSRASIHNWKQRLSPEEVDRVRKLTDGVSQLYYPEDSWS